MAFTETTKIYLGILDDGVVEFRRTRVVLEDAEIVGEKHHRQVLTPGQDVAMLPAKVRQICAVVWTPTVIAAYEAAKAARLAQSGL